MIEVFKTNVMSHEQANMLIAQLENVFADFKINFDLDDCDRILRIESELTVDTAVITSFIQSMGYEAEVLPDEIPQASSIQQHRYAETFNA